MDTAQFLGRVLPATGVYFIVRSAGKGQIHQACGSIAEAAQFALLCDAQGLTTYHACAAYREPEVIDAQGKRHWRQHSNVRALKAFWMDLDIAAGDPAKYASQSEALDALIDFCTKTKLPIPMIVSSGWGLHIYWALENEIQPEPWRETAGKLKALAAALKLRADPACTSDPARILRPIGTANRKAERDPRWVELIADCADNSFDAFARVVENNIADRKIATDTRKVHNPVTAIERLSQDAAVKRDFPPCSGAKVAERCAQVRAFRDTPANLSEPHLYSVIQLLIHAVEGDELIHQWAGGHPNYDRASGFIDKKITQNREQAIGPTLCTTFQSRNPAGCDGCPFKGKVSTPAQLGTQIARAAAPTIDQIVDDQAVKVTLPDPPHGFTRGASGGIYYEDADGITHKIYEHDLFPVERSHDEQLGYETIRWRHFLPKDGWQEFVIRSSLVCKPVELEAIMRDHSVQPLIRSKLAGYADAYMRKMRDEVEMRRLFRAQGWKNDNTEFVLGNKLYRNNEVVAAGFSHGKTDFLKPFHSRGSLEVWSAMTSAFAHPGFEPHAYMLSIAFAPPLLALDYRQGFTICALGESGAGKSTSAQVAASVYSTPMGAWVGRNDSQLAVYQRMGAHCNLPVYMDESSTITAKELRDLVYEIPIGKSRTTMKADYTLRQGAEWATIFVTSSNDSLQAKLSLEKANAVAENMRLFEFKFPVVDAFGPIAKMIPGIINENYGLAGPEYIRRLVADRVQIRADFAEYIKQIEHEFAFANEERFWLVGVAAPLFGAKLAYQWGLIEFDPDKLKPWLMAEVRGMRSNLAQNKLTPVDILSEYLNQHIGERVVITSINAGMAPFDTRLIREISQRYEPEVNTLWVSRQHLTSRLRKQNFNVTELQDYLTMQGILASPNVRKTLGAGTNMTGGSVACWQIKTDHPDLAGIQL